MMSRYARVLAAMHNNPDQQINALEQRIKELEKRLAVSEKNLVEAIHRADARTQFLAHTSHELRTPLNSIIGYAQLYELKNQRSKLPENRYVSEILKASRHLLQLITDLLDLSRIDINKIELSIENVDAGDVIRNCLATIKPLADERQLVLSYDPRSCIDTWVIADPVRLKQVLLNLLSNAVKYNAEAGSITVSCDKSWGNRVRISLSDTSPGFHKKELDHLFDPLSRLYSETCRVEGYGIGLAISKQLIELMHGRIGVDSEYGHGSTFWIELDVAKERPEIHEDGGQYKMDYDASVRSTLLYVEDSPTHMNLVEDILASMPDIRFIGAHTPMLGLELARTHKPDIILLDISMPGMDGYEFFEHLRRQKASSRIPVIALSASALSAEIERGLQQGFARYLTKPIDIAVFRKAVQEVLRDSKLR